MGRISALPPHMHTVDCLFWSTLFNSYHSVNETFVWTALTVLCNRWESRKQVFKAKRGKAEEEQKSRVLYMKRSVTNGRH